MKRMYLIVLSLMMCSSAIFAQSIKSYVITSAGTALMSEEGSLYLSIGEPMNTEITEGEIMISQGFLNVTIAGSLVSTDDLLSEVIRVYPNPTAARVEIEIPEYSGDYFYSLVNATGHLGPSYDSWVNDGTGCH